MENFKGTKGKWDNYGGDNSSIDIVLPDNTTISVDRYDRYSSDSSFGCTRLEMEANAQLIAHAPEMLEMLQIWCMDMEERGKAYGDCYNMTKDLITRATTI